MSGQPTYRTEAELCAAFVEALPPGWAAYPETAGWDILLVRTGEAIRLSPRGSGQGCCSRWDQGDGGDEVATDEQIGIQAKLRSNLEVLSQATETERGPAFRSVLVAAIGSGFAPVAQRLRLGIFYPNSSSSLHGFEFRANSFRDPFRCCIGDRWGRDKMALPPVLPDLPAGVPGPRSLTPWRVGALRLCTLLRERGWLTKADFAAHGVDHRRWTSRGSWLVPGTKRGTYVAMPGAALPDVGWESVAAQLAAADKEKSA